MALLSRKWIVKNGLVVPKRELVHTKRSERVSRANLIIGYRDRQFLPPFYPAHEPEVCAINIDATGTVQDQASALTSFNYSGITVGSGLSNGALIAFVAWNGAISSPTATWDSGGTNQSMTLIKLIAANIACCAMFGLVNPTSGNKTLALSWTTGAPVHCNAQSYTGVLQTGGVTTWPNATSNSHAATSAAISVTITSAVGNQPTAMFAFGTSGTTISSVSGTQIYIENGGGLPVNGADFTAGAASVTLTGTPSQNSIAGAVGSDMVAAPGISGSTLLIRSKRPGWNW